MRKRKKINWWIGTCAIATVLTLIDGGWLLAVNPQGVALTIGATLEAALLGLAILFWPRAKYEVSLLRSR